MNLTCALINFDATSIKFLQQLISTNPSLKITQIIPDLELGITELDIERRPDITFLWIGRNEKKWQNKTAVIAEKSNALVIISSRSSNASFAYDLKANDFLKFPFSPNRFKQCITQCNIVIGQKGYTSLADFFFVKTWSDKRQLVKISYSDVVCFESKDKGVIIHTKTEKIACSYTLQQIENAISKYVQFVRIHRSYIISFTHIEQIEQTSVKLTNYSHPITVGKIYLERYLSCLKPLTLRTTFS